ncbi:MAG: hypothetical protein AVDCRST_MAG16-431, partial [uncultured Frankineae bacterium]
VRSPARAARAPGAARADAGHGARGAPAARRLGERAARAVPRAGPPRGGGDVRQPGLRARARALLAAAADRPAAAGARPL